MRLDETQGYLCAALAGPQPIPEGQWLSEVLGDAEDRFGAAGREAAALLRLLAARLQVELASGEAPLLLLYAEDDDENSCQRLHSVVRSLSAWHRHRARRLVRGAGRRRRQGGQ
jgi:yecA family protein